jgi:teichuronic acid biosynthesis glycosyltransferase TuaC
VVSARGTDINLFPTFRTIRPQIQWTLQKAQQVIAVSGGLKQKILELGIPGDKVQVIGNGIDPAKFRPHDRADSRARLGIPSEAQVAICVAGLVAPKGHSYLLEAAASLAQTLPALRMYFIGKGTLLQQLTEKSRALGIADRVQFVGSRPHEELQYWFSAADVSCLISQREGCPNAVAESLACGCPVIGSDIPGIQELICNQQLGILVLRDSSAVAKALETAFAKRWDREAISDSMAGKTWTQVARQVETVFLQALQVTPT